MRNRTVAAALAGLCLAALPAAALGADEAPTPEIAELTPSPAPEATATPAPGDDEELPGYPPEPVGEVRPDSPQPPVDDALESPPAPPGEVIPVAWPYGASSAWAAPRHASITGDARSASATTPTPEVTVARRTGPGILRILRGAVFSIGGRHMTVITRK